MKKVKLLLLLITLTSTGVLAQQRIAAHITTESRDTPQRNNELPRINTADRNKIIKPYKGQTIYNINKKTYETFNGTLIRTERRTEQNRTLIRTERRTER